MKKIKLLVLVLITGIFLLSCGNKQSKDTSNVSSEQIKNNIKSNQDERYGSDLVGYVTKPEEWKYFNDENASQGPDPVPQTPQGFIFLKNSADGAPAGF